MDAKSIVAGPGGRALIREAGKPARVALPMQCAVDALSDRDKDVLHRFFDALQMSWGNMTVAEMHGEPRGRYARYSERVTLPTYAAYEVDAFRWIARNALGAESRGWAEYLARMQAEDKLKYNFLEWGAALINTENRDMALGAAIASLRTLAFRLGDAYRQYNREMERLQRTAETVRQAVASHKPNLAITSEG